MSKGPHHQYVFRRFAGSMQMRIKTFADVLAVRQLPEVHWVALACPTSGLSCDPRFLQQLDRDGNGRVRAREIEEAISWTEQMLANHEGCVPGSEELVLDHLSPTAINLRHTADLVLANLQAQDRTRITLQQLSQNDKILGKNDSNGDGIIGPTAIGDATLRAAAEDILKILPGGKDITGERGIDIATIKLFHDDRLKALKWHDQRAELSKWGERSVEQARAVRAVQPRLDEYFMQCRLVATQPDAAAQLRADQPRMLGTLGNPDALKATLAALPIAPPSADGKLRWSTRYRGEAWEALERFRVDVATPLLSDAGDGLDEAQWLRIKSEAAPILAWDDQAKNHPLLSLGAERLRALDGAVIDGLRKLSEQDLKFGEILAKINELQRLILFQRWLFTFVNNFVSMPNMYGGSQPALFDQGTLFLAGREFSFAVLVPNLAEHKSYSTDSTMFTMYVEVTGGKPERKFMVAVPVTAGTGGGIFVGKRGIFRTDDGQEYDAIVKDVIVQPVSLFEAMTQPFTKIGKFFTSKIEKLSTDMDKNFDQQVTDRAKVVAAPAAPPAPGAPPANMNMVMGASVAFAAVTSGLAFVSKTVGENVPAVVGGLICVCIALAVPTTIIAWLKLRKRNLAVVLEGSGWALNERLRLTRGLGSLFTRRRKRPKGSKFELADQVASLMKLRRKKDDEFVDIDSSWLQKALVLTALLLLGVGWYIYFGPSPYAEDKRLKQLSDDLNGFKAKYNRVEFTIADDKLLVTGFVDSEEDQKELNSLVEQKRRDFLFFDPEVDSSGLKISPPASTAAESPAK
jgi:hypothetical protein